MHTTKSIETLNAVELIEQTQKALFFRKLAAETGRIIALPEDFNAWVRHLKVRLAEAEIAREPKHVLKVMRSALDYAASEAR